MRTVRAILILVCVALASPPVWSGSGEPDTVYGNLIDRKIERCEQKAKLLEAQVGNLKGTCDVARAQASYYREQREQLIQEMKEKNVGNSPTKANVLLIEAYKGHARVKGTAIATGIRE